MTEKEIIQALRLCSCETSIRNCPTCPLSGNDDCVTDALRGAADLIERLTAEDKEDADGKTNVADLESLCSYDHLRELAEADKDGRVVVLPCKVGDTVYFVNAKQILEFAVVGYAVDETGISWVHSEHVDKIGNTNERTFSPDRFGKNTFFTREEAEKALQEMGGKKDG